MIDIHPPHHAATTRRDFFIHLITVVLGILIAIGLEQTVEFFHHRHQVAEAREALRVEREQNLLLLALETRGFLRRIPYLKTNLAVLVYIREHPHAPSAAWPGVLDWASGSIPFNESAWTSAQRDSVVTYMPNAEVEDLSDLYARLDRIRAYQLDERDAINDARGYLARDPDPSRLTPHELDDLIDHATRILVLHNRLGSEMLHLALRHQDFAPSASDQREFAVLPTPVTPQDARDSDTERQEYLRIVNAH
jgi:hypothetical protein